MGTFKFEIESFTADKIFTKEQILFGTRRAMKGTAADIVRRLGTGVTVREIIQKFNSIEGNIEISKPYLENCMPVHKVRIV